jgi:PilZ domain
MLLCRSTRTGAACVASGTLPSPDVLWRASGLFFEHRGNDNEALSYCRRAASANVGYPFLPQMKQKHLERAVRRSRHLSAWIKAGGRAHVECQVLDISTHGAKIVVGVPSAVPDHFELAFSQGGQRRVCEVVWRRAKTLGVKFIY